MEMQFDKIGNLSNDVILTCKEFKKLFGYNKQRKNKIENLFTVATKFKNIGCDTMYVFGSFVTQKENPNDIDVCFDISNIDTTVLEKNYSLFDKYEFRRHHEFLKVHLPFFKIKTDDIELLNFMKKDRERNERGIVKVNLKDVTDI